MFLETKNGITVIKVTWLKTWTAEWIPNNKISDEETKPKKSAKMKNGKNMQSMRDKIKSQETHPDRPISILIGVSEKKINSKGKKNSSAWKRVWKIYTKSLIAVISGNKNGMEVEQREH